MVCAAGDEKEEKESEEEKEVEAEVKKKVRIADEVDFAPSAAGVAEADFEDEEVSILHCRTAAPNMLHFFGCSQLMDKISLIASLIACAMTERICFCGLL